MSNEEKKIEITLSFAREVLSRLRVQSNGSPVNSYSEQVYLKFIELMESQGIIFIEEQK